MVQHDVSKLEYASVVWNPSFKYLTESIEKVQRRFLKYLVFRIDGIYPIRNIPQKLLLSRFSILSLECRRIINLVMFLHSLVNNRLDAPSLLEQVCYWARPRSLRDKSIFYIKKSRTNILKFSPIYMMQMYFDKFNADVNIDIHVVSGQVLRKHLTNYFLNKNGIDIGSGVWSSSWDWDWFSTG